MYVQYKHIFRGEKIKLTIEKRKEYLTQQVNETFKNIYILSMMTTFGSTHHIVTIKYIVHARHYNYYYTL